MCAASAIASAPRDIRLTSQDYSVALIDLATVLSRHSYLNFFLHSVNNILVIFFREKIWALNENKEHVLL